jgi:hypothetical protein
MRSSGRVSGRLGPRLGPGGADPVVEACARPPPGRLGAPQRGDRAVGWAGVWAGGLAGGLGAAPGGLGGSRLPGAAGEAEGGGEGGYVIGWPSSLTAGRRPDTSPACLSQDVPVP